MSPKKKRKKAQKKAQKTCGDLGGRTSDGQPCSLPAGWGTKKDTGFCKYHSGEASARMQASKKKFLQEYSRGTVSMTHAARLAGVDHSTIWRWRQADPEFDTQVLAVQEEVDVIRADMVEESMFKQIIDGKATSVDRIFWLTNRAPGRWKNRQRIEHTDGEGNPLSIRIYLPENGRDPGDEQ